MKNENSKKTQTYKNLSDNKSISGKSKTSPVTGSDKGNDSTTQKPARPPIKFIAISAVVLAAIITGVLAILFSSGIIGGRDTVLKAGSTKISSEVYCYLASYYKQRFISENKQEYGAEDTDAFWSKIYDETSGKTFGDVLREGVEDYVKRVAVSAELYDANAGGISKTDKAAIEDAIDDVLEYKANGSKSDFNKMTEPYKFTFDAFKEATVLLFKSGYLSNALYGMDGAALYYATDKCEEYYTNEFSRVLIVFIRTHDKLVTDDEGNYVVGDDGKYETEPMTPEEIERANALVNEIASHADDDTVSEEYIRYCIEEYDQSGTNGEYYFSIYNTAAYDYYTEVSSATVESALEMKTGELRVEESEYGKHIIYKLPLEASGYKNVDKELFFKDFYTDAAKYFTDKLIEENLSSVIIYEDKLNLSDPVTIPPQSKFVAYL